MGFYAYFSLRLPSLFPIVETHPDNGSTADLRLLTPWPELFEFVGRMAANFDHQNDHEHGHLPMIVILLYFLEKWKLTHGGAKPRTYAEKLAFRELVAQGARTNNSEGGEENFDEAVAAVMKHISHPSLPESLRQIFDDVDHLKVRFSSENLAFLPKSASKLVLGSNNVCSGRCTWRFLDHFKSRAAIPSETPAAPIAWRAARYEGAI